MPRRPMQERSDKNNRQLSIAGQLTHVSQDDVLPIDHGAGTPILEAGSEVTLDSSEDHPTQDVMLR